MSPLMLFKQTTIWQLTIQRHRHTPKTGEVKRQDEVVYVVEREKNYVIEKFVT